MAKLRSAVLLACLPLFALAADYAGAQSQSGFGNQQGQTEAQNFVAQQGSAINSTTTSGTAASVPGGSANTSGYQSLANNPSALPSEGQAAASNDPTNALMSGAYTNQQSTTINSTDQWYQSALASSTNANGAVATSGSTSQSCSTSQTQTQVTSNDGVYTCETTETVTDTPSQCVQNLIVSTTTTNKYSCNNTYDQTQRQWVVSPACAALAADGVCTNTGSTCTAPAPPYFQPVQCEQGTQWNSQSQSCSETRNIVVGTKYNYACANTYDPNTKTWTTSPACAALSASSSCVQQSQTCSQPTPPIVKTCQQGVQSSQASEVCNPVRQVTVGTNYIYDAFKNWNGSSYVPTSQESALQSAAASGICTLQATNCTANYPAQTYSCETGYSTSTATSTCNAQATVQTTNPYWKYSCLIAPQGLDPKANCNEFTGLPCTVIAAPSGQSSTTYTYTCSVSVDYTAYDNVTLIAQGATLVGQGWTSCNQDSTSGCSMTSESCPGGGGYVKDAYGNSYYVSCLTQVRNYSCTTTTNAAGCSPPAGSTETASSCVAKDANGNCTETSEIWTTPGGCASDEDQWLCSADVPAADPYASTQLYIASDTWSNDCASEAANPACTLQSSIITQGPGTRIINGLSVTEPSWALQNTYSCTVQAPVDTCTGNVTGCTETAQACAATDANGTCILWNDTYSCPNNDGSGGCEQQSYAYVCTADIAAADPYQSSFPYLVSDNWTTQCQALASNGACSLTNTQTDGPATKVIDGLSVTEPDWNQTQTYTCWSSQPVNGCGSQVTGCTFVSKSCAGNDAQGNCSLWTYNYSCPADDGSGNCSVKNYTYTCTGSTLAAADVPPADPAVSSTTVVSGATWSPPQCAQASQTNCAATGTTCNDANSTKTVNGISVTEACWQQTTNYTCETTGTPTNNCQVPAGCTYTGDQCLDNPPPAPGKPCGSLQHNYSCTSTSTKTVTSSSCSTQMCVGSQCFQVSGATDSSSLAKAYTALSTAHMAGADYSNPANNLQIMKGAPYHCYKELTGFDNCCKDSGWAQGVFSNCSTEEKTLIQMEQAKECHYIGTYCSNSSFFGICLQKKMVYCCFEGSLARIINEAGRPQVNKTWGSAKNPDCSGFTVAQFQSLDLSHVDFSDFYNQALGNLAAPDSGTTTTNIENTLKQLQQGNTPTNMTPGGG